MRTPGTAETIKVDEILHDLYYRQNAGTAVVDTLDDAINALVDRERRDAVETYKREQESTDA